MELAAKYDELVGLHAPLSDGRDADDSPWEGRRFDAKLESDDFDPGDPALQDAIAERLSAAAARMSGLVQ